jgi:DNA-binding response OmpR family regulator
MNEQGSRPPRILVVEGDPTMGQMVVNYLDEHSIRAVSISGCQEMRRHFAESEPNLVILDLRHDEEDGLDLLRKIRARSNVPVIITAGHRRDEIDRVVGARARRR